MTPITESPGEHAEVWNLLPWHVIARLSESEGRRVEDHLRTCAGCRAELAEQRRLHAIMAADSRFEQLPTAGLKRLQQRLAMQDTILAAPMADDPDRPLVAGRRSWQGLMAASVAVMAVALSIVAGVLWSQSRRPASSADYFTVTSAAPRPENEVIRAVFAPTITLLDLQSVLDDAHLKIVAGPTEAGVYSLAAAGSQPPAWSLQRLRAQHTVRFAEVTADGAPTRPSP